MVLGSVRVTDWRHLSARWPAEYDARYRAESPFRARHVHGANMGFRADAYWVWGGSRRWRLAKTSTWSALPRRPVDAYTRMPASRWNTSARWDGAGPRRLRRPPRGDLPRGRGQSGQDRRGVMTAPRCWRGCGLVDCSCRSRVGLEVVERWRRLAQLTELDVAAGRLAEAHTDALAILAELGGQTPGPGNSGACGQPRRPSRSSWPTTTGTVALEGTKAWCSGAGLCTHALVTARLDDGRRGCSPSI